jgi:acyl-CoA reductase-like NAD-dependent aldehyde dehydrogenase
MTTKPDTARAATETQSIVEVRSPATGALVGSVPDMTPVEVHAIAERLRAAQPAWERLGFSGRRKWLERYRDWLLDHEQDLLQLVQEETGKSWGDLALGEITPAVDVLNYYASRGERFLRPTTTRPHSLAMANKRLRTTHHPHQLVGSITPWNSQIAMQMLDVPAALMAGCAVLTKASEETPLAWAAAVEGWRSIGAPDVLGVVSGRGATGAAMVDEVDMMQFTGSVGTGRRIGIRAAERMIPCCLELGGKDAFVVLADADLDRAVGAALWGGFYNAGQICVSTERVYVVAEVYDEFVARLAEGVSRLRVGTDAPGSFASDVGAIATAGQLALIEAHVADAVERGARVLTGGNRVEGPGLYFEPTVLVDVDHGMRCVREETFGPTLPVIKVADDEEAIRLANDSDFGLAATVFSRDRTHARSVADRIDSGTVNINNVMTNVFQLPVAFGGRRQSGLGARHGGAVGMRKYCWTKSVIEERIPLKSELYWYPTTPGRSRAMLAASRFLGAGDWRRRLNRAAPSAYAAATEEGKE